MRDRNFPIGDLDHTRSCSFPGLPQEFITLLGGAAAVWPLAWFRRVSRDDRLVSSLAAAMDAARAGRYGANMVLLALTAIGITLVIERDIRRRLLPSGRAEYGVLIASAILSVIIGARCANHRLRLCARRRWLRDRCAPACQAMELQMWITIFALTFATAITFGVASVMLHDRPAIAAPKR